MLFNYRPDRPVAQAVAVDVTLHSNPGISAFCNQSFSDNSLQFYGIEIPECCTQIPDEVRVKVCPGFECKSGATWKPRGKRTGSWL
jgi:hypothetical protein